MSERILQHNICKINAGVCNYCKVGLLTFFSISECMTDIINDIIIVTHVDIIFIDLRRNRVILYFN